MQLRIRRTGLLSGLDCIELVHQRLAGTLKEVEVALLNGIYTGKDLLFLDMVASLTGAIDIEQRTPHPVIGNLGGSVPLIWHMTIRAGDTRSRMNPLRPQLKLRMLGFENLSAALTMLIVI